MATTRTRTGTRSRGPVTDERDRSETIKSALCACGCGKPWVKWCRACNLVYAAEHADPGSHRCPPFERPVPAGVEEKPKKRRQRVKKE